MENQCPNCGELILHTEERLDCPYCGYGCDYPYADDDGHTGFWMGVEQDDGELITAHVRADKNLSPETASALAEMIKAAYKAINEGTLPRKKP